MTAEPIVLDNIYTLGKKIGDGGMAEVFLADVNLDNFDYTMLYAYTQVQGDNHIERFQNAEAFARELQGQDLDVKTVQTILKAHKIPLPEGKVAIKLAKDGLNNDRFMAEWKGLVCLHHENVIQVYGGGMHGDKPYYAMEVLPTILSTKEIHQFCLRDKIDYIIQSAQGLGYLHEHGIIHRDVKPDNLLACKKEDGGFVVKVSDLGIAKGAGEVSGMTMTTAVMGTPCFMSPEQAKSSKNVDERADVYSLGATLYKLITNTLPYADKTSIFEIISAISSNEPPVPPKDVNPDLPEELAQIIQCAMAFNIEERYASMDELIHDLKEYLNTMGTVALSRATDVLRADTIVGTATTGALTTGNFIFQTRTAGSIAGATVDTSAATITTEAGQPTAQTLPGVDQQTLAQTQAEIQVQKAARNLTRLTILALLLIVAAAAYFGGWFSRERARGRSRSGNPYLSDNQVDFDTVYSEVEKLYLAGTPDELDKAATRGQEALAIARSKAERTTINRLLVKIDAKRQELTLAKKHKELMEAGTKAMNDKDLALALEKIQQANELMESKKATDLLFEIKNMMLLKDKYDNTIRKAQQLLAKSDYAAAGDAFGAALKIQGYAQDKVALDGRLGARKAQYNALMLAGKDALRNKQWRAAIQAFQNALAVPGFENTREPTALIAKVRANQTRSELAAAFREAMSKAMSQLQKHQYKSAETTFAQALQIEGFRRDRKALAGLRQAREARHAMAMENGRKLLAAAQWKPAIAALKEALSVPGYEKDKEAMLGIQRAQKSLQGAAWKSGVPPMAISESSLPGLRVRKNGPDQSVRRSMPEMKPEPPKLYGYFLPKPE